MRGLEFSSVKAAFTHMSSDERVAAHNLSDLFWLDLFTHFAVNGVDHVRGTQDWPPRINAAGLQPVVIDLGEHACLVLMDGTCHTPIMRDDLGIKAMDKRLIG